MSYGMAQIDLEYEFDGARKLTPEMLFSKKSWHSNLYAEDRIIFPGK